MSQWAVLNSLRQITFLDNEGAADALPLCNSAYEEVIAGLRDDADKADIRVLNAAAAIANYNLKIRKLSEDENITSFKAGDVSIGSNFTSVIGTADRIKTEKLLAVLPLMRDEEFIFKQVGT